MLDLHPHWLPRVRNDRYVGHWAGSARGREQGSAEAYQGEVLAVLGHRESEKGEFTVVRGAGVCGMSAGTES